MQRPHGGKTGSPVEATVDYHYELSKDSPTRPVSDADPLAVTVAAASTPTDDMCNGYWKGARISDDLHAFLLGVCEHIPEEDYETSNTAGRDAGFGDEPYAAVTGQTKKQVWERIKPHFWSVCPPFLKGKVNRNMDRMRFSVNRIEGGLGRHYDHCVLNQPFFEDPEAVLTQPGVSFSIHVG